MIGANFRGADLSSADLTHAHLVNVDLRTASINGCRVYGMSAWNVNTEGAKQSDLVITPDGEPLIAIDHLEVAQFVYLLLNNAKIRDVIDTVTAKAVLILGRFTPERKAVLEVIRGALRGKGYLPILFDFERPASRDVTETVSTLAHMARFVVADISEPKSIPQELTRIVGNLPSVPVRPLIHESEREYGMFEHFKRFPWVLDLLKYSDADQLEGVLEDQVIRPCEAKAEEIRPRVAGN